ncbi:FAD-binding oxidoreductase [Marinobacter persicus]|uniref:NAD(P)H-flavin reductase n=1 Tax=Marinobacter persicus TaxID=930118 RepID=A0A2S6G9S0_9GAMM|nr:FAD-binding oxidoreductase [Marinobacter persicus]PPK53116.1 NAD(P)H-flavin reductase [Marinobacter persicus]PPK55993.1 NAD(P)H-flavin reductase [Marinobacter persicus]PPK59589.1 NAD(P)H-flavin reductase [Marinobacter persicus]
MASDSDLSGARQGAQHSLAEQDALSQRQAGCSSDSLRATLAGIGQLKPRQARRMLEWLARHEPGASAPPPTSSPFTSDPVGTVESTGETTDDSSEESTANTEPAGPTSGEGGEILERRDITPELLVLKVARPEDFDYVAGQSVKVEFGGVRRTYSLVSAPHEPFLEFFIELVPGGRMSQQLSQVKEGDRLVLGKARGGLRFDERYPNHLMVATVTGINPFVSILRDYVHKGSQGHHFHVMHGASYQSEHGYREELAAMASAHPDLITYTATVSRPDEAANEGWTGQTGRVNTLVAEYLSSAGLTVDNTLVYACGHSGMIDAVTGEVEKSDFRLKTENYG